MRLSLRSPGAGSGAERERRAQALDRLRVECALARDEPEQRELGCEVLRVARARDAKRLAQRNLDSTGGASFTDCM